MANQSRLRRSYSCALAVSKSVGQVALSPLQLQAKDSDLRIIYLDIRLVRAFIQQRTQAVPLCAVG